MSPRCSQCIRLVTERTGIFSICSFLTFFLEKKLLSVLVVCLLTPCRILTLGHKYTHEHRTFWILGHLIKRAGHLQILQSHDALVTCSGVVEESPSSIPPVLLPSPLSHPPTNEEPPQKHVLSISCSRRAAASAEPVCPAHTFQSILGTPQNRDR